VCVCVWKERCPHTGAQDRERRNTEVNGIASVPLIFFFSVCAHRPRYLSSTITHRWARGRPSWRSHWSCPLCSWSCCSSLRRAGATQRERRNSARSSRPSLLNILPTFHIALVAPPVSHLSTFSRPSPSPNRSFQAGVLRLTSATLGLPVLGSAVRLSHAMVAGSGAALLSAARAATAARSGAPHAFAGAGASAVTAALAKRWRAERNAWIAFCAFSFWLILLRTHALVVALAAEREGRSGGVPAPPASSTRLGGGGSGVASGPLDRSASAAAAARAGAKEAALAGGAPSAPPLATKKGQ